MGIRRWMQKRRIKKQLSGIRKIELDVVDSYMEKVYNPLLVLSKPKYRYKYIPEEKELIRLYLHKMYNPPVVPRYRKDHTLDEYMKGEVKT